MVSEHNVHILFCRHIWAELSLLFWTFLSGTFFPGGGGGARAPSAPPLAYAPGHFIAFDSSQCQIPTLAPGGGGRVGGSIDWCITNP